MKRMMESIGEKRQKLEVATGIEGLHALQAHNRRQQRNLEAEDRAARKKLWGDDGDQDMGDQQTVLGDYVINQTGQQTPQKSLLPLLLAGLVGVGGPLAVGAGVAGHMLIDELLKEKPAPSTPKFQDETVNLRIGKE